MIHVRNVSWKPGHNYILNNVSASIYPGDYVLVVGPNGSGKSSLLDIIAGSKTPHNGALYYNDRDITAVPEYERTAYIARLSQDPRNNTVDRLTVGENIALARSQGTFASLRNALRDKDAIISMLTDFGFSEYIYNTVMHNLSGGQRQKIAFIMATCMQPDILLLDEPTAALDTRNATQLLSWVTWYQKTHNIAIVMVTHDPDAVAHLGNCIWWVRDGSVRRWTRHQLREADIDVADIMGRIDYKAIQSAH